MSEANCVSLKCSANTFGVRLGCAICSIHFIVDSPAVLASPFLMIVVGYLGHLRDYVLTGEEADRLKQWALVANAKGRFSRGSSETILDQDLAQLSRNASVTGLLDRVRVQFGRLGVDAEDLEGKSQRSSLFKTMFLAFSEAGARDWRSNLAISLHHTGGRDRLQFHHFFPKALLARHGFAREADEIANLAFIGGKTNRQIADKEPAQYLPSILGEDVRGALEAQAIPVDPELWKIERYGDFLVERRRLIAQRLNAFMGTTSSE